MYKIPISGGPHTGKSFLLEALRTLYPDAYFLPEPATSIITSELAKHAQDTTYMPLLPHTDLDGFNRAVVQRYIAQEQQLRGREGLAFLDRSLWDSVAHFSLAGAEDMLPQLEQLAKTAEYSMVIFCEPIGTYTQTNTRRETQEEAMVQHEAFRSIYTKSDLPMLILPSVSIEERLIIVKNAFNDIIGDTSSVHKTIPVH